MSLAPGSGRLLALLAPLALAACAGAPSIATRGPRFEHGVQGVPPAERSELWFSYQIEVVAVDGVATRYRAPPRVLYACLILAAGTHRLELCLDYEAPLQVVRAEAPAELNVELAAGAAYRVIDLNAGRKRAHVFAPVLLEGAPPDEHLQLRRPREDAGGALR